MKLHKMLSDNAIEHYLEIPSGSEDGMELSEEDSDSEMRRIGNFVLQELGQSSELLHDNDLNQSTASAQETNVLDSYTDFGEAQPSTSGCFSNSSTTLTSSYPAGTSDRVTTRRNTHSRSSIRIIRPTKPPVKSVRNKRRYIWRKVSFQPPPTAFTGDENIGQPFISFDSPLQYFLYFFDDDLLQHMAEESTKYSIQKNPSKPLLVTKTELRKFLGISLIMGLVPLPNVRMYWNNEIGLPLIYNTMTLTDFERLRSNMHFNDNQNYKPRGEAGHDRLFRIRPILETLKKKCQNISKRETLSVDEQMCATKACNFLRQYLPNKPHKWGYKLLVLCDDTGFAYDFEIYSGTENDPALRLEDEPDLGASCNIVVRLCRSVPKNQMYKVFFDNYYTSPELIAYLSKSGIHSLGTVNKGRLGKNIVLPTHKELLRAKKPRGYSEEWTATVDGVPITAVMWLDNKPVVLASSFIGEQPKEKTQRYCKKEGYINVDCPNIIRQYNRHMGGVDLLDSFIGKHKIKMRTRKWYMRLFYHLLDVMIINSWILYKRVQEQNGKKGDLKLREFRLEVGKALCLSGPSLTRKRGRPSTWLENKLEERKKKKPKAIVPPKESRTDGIEHFPIWEKSRQRCKLPLCKGKSFVSCQKCNVTLCLNKDKNCFLAYHQ